MIMDYNRVVRDPELDILLKGLYREVEKAV